MITVTIEEKSKIEEIIKGCKVCYLGLIDTEGLPYVIPMNFGYQDDIIYMHSAPDGHSIRSLEKNPDVCVTFCSETKLSFQHSEVACSYRMKGSSVMCRGKVEFVEDFDEKVEVLNILMKHYTNKYFEYSNPAVVNVKVWKIEIDSITSREFGARNPKSMDRNPS